MSGVDCIEKRWMDAFKKWMDGWDDVCFLDHEANVKMSIAHPSPSQPKEARTRLCWSRSRWYDNQQMQLSKRQCNSPFSMPFFFFFIGCNVVP